VWQHRNVKTLIVNGNVLVLMVRATLGLLLCCFAAAAPAAVVRIEVDACRDLAGGMSYGLAGVYEKLVGRIHYEVDPRNPANRVITDIGHAPLNAAGRVEFAADFYLLKPKDIHSGNATVLFDAVNRGRKGSLSEFNGAPWFVNDPETAADLGDGFLMREGFTVLWVGWQHDTPPGEHLMRAYLPIATDGGRPIEGLVRHDFFVAEPAPDHSLGDRGHAPYAVSDPKDPRNVLTVRDGATAERRVVPRGQWAFARCEGARRVPDATRICLEGGFRPDRIYELVYVSQDPKVDGLGLAAIRDAVAHLKDGSEALAIPAGSIDRAIGYGLSQTGRLMRTFVHDGFNEDERHRKVFDGILSHTAGSARGSFNLRFAQPSRDLDLNFHYPADVFPFHDAVQTDPVTGQRGGLLARVAREFMPRIFYTNTATEYWIRPTALIHTDVEATRDVPPMDNVRIYLFAGAQHIPAPFPPGIAFGELRANPLDYRWFMRALLVAMNRWVRDEAPPPPSRYPTLADGTLVPVGAFRFPGLRGVAPPSELPTAFRLDYGPRFEAERVITREPPGLVTPYPILVSQVDASGNETAGLRAPELAVPLATYAGWRPFETLFVPISDGIYLPFARTKAEREARGDPRPSIEERYADRAQYLGSIATAALPLIEQGYVLAEDLPPLLRSAARLWDHLQSTP
jgi:hypothetical protein